MAKKGYTPEQIINKLREAEVMLSQGAPIALISKKTESATIPTIAGEKNMEV